MHGNIYFAVPVEQNNTPRKKEPTSLSRLHLYSFAAGFDLSPQNRLDTLAPWVVPQFFAFFFWLCFLL
jgi:hypothetical protein